MRWAAIKEAGDEPVEPSMIARLQWETSGQLIDEKFCVIMAYEGVTPVGYISVCQGHIAGLHDDTGLYVVGWYIKPEHRRGPVATRLSLSLVKTAADIGVRRIQGLVRSNPVGKMLECHGFKPVGTVYELEVGHGPELRPAAGQEVHREAS
jgi:hypothetical protein